jgi:pantoate kinase
METAAEAFVPGHVTALFSVHRRETATRTGSRGAGITLTDGVTVRVGPGAGVTLDGEAASIEAVDRVRDALGVECRVAVESDLPVGAGFGVSGAAALGTALAANAAFDCERSENALVERAHVAEVEARSGLGDVVAQARGGIPLRLEPGAPGHGELDGVPGYGRVEYLSLGELSTAEVIGGDTDALSAAGERALAEIRERPTLDRLVAAGRRFAEEADLLTDAIRDVLADVEAAGGRASMVMLGESVFAPGRGLSAAGYDPAVCRVHPAGATLRFSADGDNPCP